MISSRGTRGIIYESTERKMADGRAPQGRKLPLGPDTSKFRREQPRPTVTMTKVLMDAYCDEGRYHPCNREVSIAPIPREGGVLMVMLGAFFLRKLNLGTGGTVEVCSIQLQRLHRCRDFSTEASDSPESHMLCCTNLFVSLLVVVWRYTIVARFYTAL